MKDNQNILVSVGVTTYDRLEMLIETLSSILGQSYQNLEILVANDNPARELTLKDLKLSEDSRVKIVNHSRNLGEINNLNWLLENSSGKYFTWLADDDVIHPQHIELLLSAMSNQTEIVASFSGYSSTFAKFQELFTTDLLSSEFRHFGANTFLLEYSRRNVSIIGCYGLFERTSLLQTGGFTILGDSFSPYSDTLIPIKLCKYGKVSVTEATSVLFRAHVSSMSNSQSNLLAFLDAETDFFQILDHETTGLSSPERREVFENFGKWFRDNHLTLISRVEGNRIRQDYSSWLIACRINRKNLAKFGYQSTQGFLSGMVVLFRHRVSVWRASKL
jgi:glycosyltransferase involved in cell wall biosynthesis